MTAIPPPDETAHLDNLLMAEVASLNAQLGRYVLRFLDADAGRTEPLSVDDERKLADQVAAAAEGMHARAARRDQHGEPLRLVGSALPEAADG
jgi:hypothetical protein